MPTIATDTSSHRFWRQDRPWLAVFALVALVSWSASARAATTFVVVEETSKLVVDATTAALLNDQLTELKSDIAYLNAKSVLPGTKAITIRIADCGFVNAYYMPSTRSITMCHEIVLEINKLLVTANAWAPQLAKDMLTFLFLHEVGHALVDQYPMPLVGSEEDAVDQFATLILMGQGVPQAALNGGAIFTLIGVAPHFSDPHSDGNKRYYNVQCLLYGKYAATTPAVAAWSLISKDQCPPYHAKIERAWTTLMSTFKS